MIDDDDEPPLCALQTTHFIYLVSFLFCSIFSDGERMTRCGIPDSDTYQAPIEEHAFNILAVNNLYMVISEMIDDFSKNVSTETPHTHTHTRSTDSLAGASTTANISDQSGASLFQFYE